VGTQGSIYSVERAQDWNGPEVSGFRRTRHQGAAPQKKTKNVKDLPFAEERGRQHAIDPSKEILERTWPEKGPPKWRKGKSFGVAWTIPGKGEKGRRTKHSTCGGIWESVGTPITGRREGGMRSPVQERFIKRKKEMGRTTESADPGKKTLLYCGGKRGGETIQKRLVPKEKY